ncbi:hypothetical protein ACMFMF_000241 [Clarireedia jacksonii]
MGSTERPSINTSVPLESSSGANSFCPYNYFTTNYNHSKYHAEIRQFSSFLPCGPDENGRMLRIDSMDPYMEFLIAMYALSNNTGIHPIYSNTFHVRLLEICRSKDGLAFLRVLLASQERTIMAAAEKLLILTVSSNDERLTRVLLNAGVSPDATSFIEGSILQIAVKKKYKNLVSLLIGVSAQVHPSSLLFNALHDDYDIEIVKLVLDYFVHDDKVAPWIERFLETLDYGKIRWSVELVDILLSYFLRLTWIHSKKVVTIFFLVAVGSGKQELVRRLLSLGADINFAKPRKPTGLESAVRMDDVSMVELLVSHGADPNRTQHNVERLPPTLLQIEVLPTALQIAAERGNLRLVRFLLNNGANVNAAPFDEILGYPNVNVRVKTTTLQCGVKGRNFAVVKALIDAGASLAESDAGNLLQTALQIACQESSYEMIHLLLSNGAKVNAESKSLLIWQTPLTSALKFKREHIIEFLLENGADINVPSKDSRFPSPLQICVELGEIDMVKRFLDLGAHAFDSGALWAATSIGNLDIIYLLLQHNKNSTGFAGEGSEIKPKDYGRAAICTAIKDRKHDASHLLLDAGVDVTRSPQKSFLACFSKFPLLRGSPRCAPLAAALSLMDIDWVRTLLEAGADVNVCPGEASDYGCAFDHLNWSSSNIEAMVELLCANGALINCCKAVRPPLQHAVQANLPGMVRLFLSKGANINPIPHIPMAYRKTALQLAVEHNLGDIVEILIGSNADVNASPAEEYGATAIQFAAINGNFKILQLLLTAGANLFACRGRWGGRTALEGAAEHGRLDMVQFILMKSTEMEGLYFEHQFCRAIKFARMGGHISLSEMIRSHQIDRYGSSECRGHEAVFVFESQWGWYGKKMLQIRAIDPSRDFDEKVYDEEFDQALFDSLSVVSSDDSEDLESERQEPNSITSPSGLVNHQESVMPGQVMNNQESSTEIDGVDYHDPWHPELPYEQGYQHGYDEILMIPPFDSDQIVPETTNPGFIIEELFEFNV